MCGGHCGSGGPGGLIQLEVADGFTVVGIHFHRVHSSSWVRGKRSTVVGQTRKLSPERDELAKSMA